MVYNSATAGASAASTSTTKSTTNNDKMKLKTEDFIKMMITQLQQQDPMEPAKNDQLLAQMSQISQLQSSTDLTSSIKGIVQQNQVGAAANLIGKSIKGVDANDKDVSGNVTAVQVTSDGANLELDNGQTVSMSRVTSIGANAPASHTVAP